LSSFEVIDPPDLGGADTLRKLDVLVRTLVTFEGIERELADAPSPRQCGRHSAQVRSLVIRTRSA